MRRLLAFIVGAASGDAEAEAEHQLNARRRCGKVRATPVSWTSMNVDGCRSHAPDPHGPMRRALGWAWATPSLEAMSLPMPQTAG